MPISHTREFLGRKTGGIATASNTKRNKLRAIGTRVQREAVFESTEQVVPTYHQPSSADVDHIDQAQCSEVV